MFLLFFSIIYISITDLQCGTHWGHSIDTSIKSVAQRKAAGAIRMSLIYIKSKTQFSSFHFMRGQNDVNESDGGEGECQVNVARTTNDDMEIPVRYFYFTLLIFGPTNFGGWSYKLTAVRPFVRPLLR